MEVAEKADDKITFREVYLSDKGEMVSKGCNANYLSEFIAMESNKRNI